MANNKANIALDDYADCVAGSLADYAQISVYLAKRYVTDNFAEIAEFWDNNVSVDTAANYLARY